MDEAFKEGRQAYFDGDHVNDNPYQSSTKEHFYWDLGFNSAGFHDKVSK